MGFRVRGLSLGLKVECSGVKCLGRWMKCLGPEGNRTDPLACFVCGPGRILSGDRSSLPARKFGENVALATVAD